MATTKHTPGPWTASGAGGTGYRWNVRGKRLDANGQPLHEVAVASVNVARTGEERAANARLIAAAPDLLAACQMVAKAFKATGPESRLLIDCVRDAIAKATE